MSPTKYAGTVVCVAAGSVVGSADGSSAAFVGLLGPRTVLGSGRLGLVRRAAGGHEGERGQGQGDRSHGRSPSVYSTTIVRVSMVGPKPSSPPEGSSVIATNVYSPGSSDDTSTSVCQG